MKPESTARRLARLEARVDALLKVIELMHDEEGAKRVAILFGQPKAINQRWVDKRRGILDHRGNHVGK